MVLVWEISEEIKDDLWNKELLQLQQFPLNYMRAVFSMSLFGGGGLACADYAELIERSLVKLYMNPDFWAQII